MKNFSINNITSQIMIEIDAEKKNSHIFTLQTNLFTGESIQSTKWQARKKKKNTFSLISRNL